MKHIHFIIKHKPLLDDLKIIRKRFSRSNECGNARKSSKKKNSPAPWNFALRSKPLVIKFDEQLSSFYISHCDFQGNNNYSSKECRCPSCGSKNKTYQSQKDRKIKILSPDLYKIYENSKNGQYNNDTKKRKTISKHTEEKNITIQKIEERSPHCNKSIQIKGHINKDTRNKRKTLRKLYENTSIVNSNSKTPLFSPNSKEDNSKRKNKNNPMKYQLQDSPGQIKRIFLLKERPTFIQNSNFHKKNKQCSPKFQATQMSHEMEQCPEPDFRYSHPMVIKIFN